MVVPTLVALAACGRAEQADRIPEPSPEPTNLLAAQSLIPEPAANPALQPAPPAPARTFEGYPCTVDCSGHEAGWAWAEDHGISDESECGGNSESFREGCVAYAESGGGARSDGDGAEDY